MTELEKQELFEKYNNNTHTIGRICCTVTLVLLLGAPFLIGWFFGAMPDLAAVGKGFLAVGIV